ncbi:MAG: hypothetical protein K0B05_09880 [Bacteroidales bacterium]|nr:hypothetical protein [Bacteroidales bacterium]
MRTIKSLLFVASLILVMFGCQSDLTDQELGKDNPLAIVEVVVGDTGGNVDCPDGYGYSSGRINYPFVYDDDGDPLTPDVPVVWPDGFTIITDGNTLSWSYTPVDGMCLDGITVIVKGGPKANVYTYLPGVDGDANLTAPINPKNNKPYGISNLTLCYNLTPCGNGECQEETAWGGNTSVNVGDSGAWWYYYINNGEVQTIWAGQTINVGTVVYTGGQLVIILTGGWELQDVEEPVKIQCYETIPNDRPAAGQFTTYKGDDLTVPVTSCNYFAIHLDVQLCPEE